MELLHIDKRFEPPAKGKFLLSEPFLHDPQFRRTVVLLGEHTIEGSVGFILNRLLNIKTSEVVPDLLVEDFPVFYGGPVEPNTLHYIHTAGELITGAQEIFDGIYWGGDIEMVNDLMERKIIKPEEFRFFLGYSGWEAGQLEGEIADKAWWVVKGNREAVFSDDLDALWGNLVKTLGKDFAHLANSPEDLLWN